ncbi:hypothetical protein M231_08055 [Tremella mesenterica]|uniref:Uncharacterized protein n=1 Tax=Tremella mesenterica TaxID=5217 RepID=A0A4Q1B9Q7_TREME|nr:hypothetical protein M231_08055 [Tremella mesenterica]
MFSTTHPMNYTMQKEGGTREGCILAVVLSLNSLFLTPIMCMFPVSGESGTSLVLGPYDDSFNWTGHFAARWRQTPNDPAWSQWEEVTKTAIATLSSKWLSERRAKSKTVTPTPAKKGGSGLLSFLSSRPSRKHNLPSSDQHPSQVRLLDADEEPQEDHNNNDGESHEFSSILDEPDSPANTEPEKPKSENTEVEEKKEITKKEGLTANELDTVKDIFGRDLKKRDSQSGSIKVMLYLAYSENSVGTVRKAYLAAFDGGQSYQAARSSSGPSGGDTQ